MRAPSVARTNTDTALRLSQISKAHVTTIPRLGAIGAALFGGTAVGGFQSREAVSPPLADAHVHLSLGLTLCAAATPDGSLTARRHKSKDRKGCCEAVLPHT